MKPELYNKYLQNIKNVKGILTPQCKKNLIEISAQVEGIRLEIGCLAGLSTICMGISAPKNSTIISVDPFKTKNLSDLAKSVLKEITEGKDIGEDFLHLWKQQTAILTDINLLPHQGDRLEQLSKVKKTLGRKKISMLFIDGLHDYENVKLDIDNYLPLVKKDGFVCFHDYREDWGVFNAVNEKIKEGILEKVRDDYLLVTRKVK